MTQIKAFTKTDAAGRQVNFRVLKGKYDFYLYVGTQLRTGLRNMSDVNAMVARALAS
jgi:hypothetical protein